MKSFIRGAMFWLALFVASATYAQTIQLIDNETGNPIPNVHYTIDEISGVSDDQGRITYTANENSILVLSHIQFGQITLSPHERAVAEKLGSFRMNNAFKELQPLTVMDKSPQSLLDEEIPLKTEDMLTHDAGAFLHQLSEINVVKKSGSYGFDPVLRGMKYERLNIVLDGVQTAHAACPNRMDPPISQIPMNTIQSVEILKGPYSLRFGNSFGGTINFLSNGTTFGAPKPVYGRASTSYESNGNILRGEGLLGWSEEKVNVEIHGAYSDGGNYIDGNGNEIKAAFNRLNFGGLIGYKINANHQISAKATINMAKDVDFPSLPMDLRSDDTYLLQLKHQFERASGVLRGWSTSIFTTQVDHVMDNRTKEFSIRMMDAITNSSTSSFGGRTEAKLILKKSILYVGADLKSELAEGDRTKTTLLGVNEGLVKVENIWQGGQIMNLGGFAEYQTRFSKYLWVLSGRVDYNEAEATDPDPNFPTSYENMNSTNFNGSLSTGITRELNQKSKLGLWIGGASRNGGITEKFINFVPVGVDPYEMIGNPQLRPETNYQVDLKYELAAKKSVFNFNVFGSYIVDYISSTIRTDLKPKTPTSPGVREYNNVGDANLFGGEISYIQELPVHLVMKLSAAYTWAENVTTGEAIAEIPPLDSRIILRGSYLKNKLFPEVTVRLVSEQTRIAETFGEKVSPGFGVMDAALGYQPFENWSFSAGVRNIFDAAYYEHLSRMMTDGSGNPIYNPGRSVYVTARVNF
jgi:iron complex outermembrane receptor protein